MIYKHFNYLQTYLKVNQWSLANINNNNNNNNLVLQEKAGKEKASS